MSDSHKDEITMGDYIRSSTDENLASIFISQADCGKCRFILECNEANRDRPISEMYAWCHKRFVKWLKDKKDNDITDWF